MQTVISIRLKQGSDRGPTTSYFEIEFSALTILITQVFAKLELPSAACGLVKLFHDEDFPDAFHLQFHPAAEWKCYHAGGTYTAPDIGTFSREEFVNFSDHREQARNRVEEFARRLSCGELTPALPQQRSIPRP